MKTTSRFAVAAAAGLFVGGIALTPAQAADLGGDCCADLEERVAELEATTVRKGNRKVSLKISGQVTKALLIWDDGDETDAYVVDNAQSGTRFRFTGSAAIRPGWSAGYYLEWQSGSAGSNNADQVNNNRNSSNTLGLRHAVWWIKSDKLGSLWVGQHSPATDNLYLLSLGGAGIASSGDIGLTTGGFQLRTSGVAGNAGLTTQRIGAYAPSFDTSRADIIRYDSPSIVGCVLSASWGENDTWDVAARCKKELNSIKVLFGIGYLENQNEGAASLAATIATERRESDTFILSGSVIHDPSGLFLTAWYADQTFAANALANTTCIAPTGCGDVDVFFVQAGIYRRWNDLGRTSIFVDFQQFDGANEGRTAAGFAGVAAGDFDTSSETDVWGFGVVQRVDAAAMELYADYHHVEVDATTNNAAGTNLINQNLEDFDRVLLGARIKF